LSSEGNSVQDVARKFTHLNAKWSDVTDRIYDKFKILKEASHEYGEFRGKYTVHSHNVSGAPSSLPDRLSCSVRSLFMWTY